MVDGGVIEFNAKISTPGFHLVGYEIRVVIGDDAVWDTIMVYDTGYKSITGPASVVLTGLASIHLVNLSTMTNIYFFLMASPFKGSDHVKPPNSKRPSNGDCL